MTNPLPADFSDLGLEGLLVLFMIACSVLVVAVAIERLWLLWRVRGSVAAGARVVALARAESLEEARKLLGATRGPARDVFLAGLDRALGTVPGDPVRAMAREQRRLAGAMKARTWLLATAGALMPFVGLFGTVIGVMSAFRSIGESGQGGFAIVSVGISQALVATAVGIAVALEAVVLYNFLQNLSQGIGRRLSLLVDELVEVIDFADRA